MHHSNSLLLWLLLSTLKVGKWGSSIQDYLLRGHSLLLRDCIGKVVLTLVLWKTVDSLWLWQLFELVDIEYSIIDLDALRSFTCLVAHLPYTQLVWSETYDCLLVTSESLATFERGFWFVDYPGILPRNMVSTFSCFQRGDTGRLKFHTDLPLLWLLL